MVTKRLRREEFDEAVKDEELLILLSPNYPKCNVNCSYCAYRRGRHQNKKREIVENLRMLRGMYIYARIEKKLEKQSIPKTLFFVPSAELFISKFYRNMFIRLLNSPSISRCCFQTNLCWDIEGFLNRIDTSKLMLWVTFHPDQYTEQQKDQFYNNISILHNRGIKFSVGVVATKNRIKHLQEYKKTFNELGAYMWINGVKGIGSYYSDKEKEIICSLDNMAQYEVELVQSRGLECSAGKDAIFIDPYGNIRRCVHVRKPRMGNILKDNISPSQNSTPCPMDYCGCFISYMILKKPEFSRIFGNTMICRLPLHAQDWQALHEYPG